MLTVFTEIKKEEDGTAQSKPYCNARIFRKFFIFSREANRAMLQEGSAMLT